MVKRAAKLGSLPVRPVGLGLSTPIDRRLDQLLFLARQAGPATRQEIVGALINASPETELAIRELLLRYHETEVGDALIRGVPVTPGNVPKKPGRRKLG